MKVRITMTVQRTYNISKADLKENYPDSNTFEDALEADLDAAKEDPIYFMNDDGIKVVSITGELIRK